MLRRALELCDRHADVRTIFAALVASVVLGVFPLSYAVARIGAGGQGAVPLDIFNDAAARGVVNRMSQGTCGSVAHAPNMRGQSVDARPPASGACWWSWGLIAGRAGLEAATMT